MASISRDKVGGRRIQFVGADGQRRAIRLGKISQRAAEDIRTRVETLNNANITGTPLDRDTARWVATRESKLLDKLAAVGLVPKRQSARLESFIDTYVDSRVDVKPATKEVWRQGKKGLIDYFGASKALREITAGDADNYRMHLIGEKLAPMTIRKRVQFAKTVFRAAQKHNLIDANPFAEVTTQATMTAGRERFITHEETAKLLDKCPGWEWRTIIALARYGGLRCPSEVLSLRLQDIDWEASKVRVTSPKTEHHPGKASRMLPLFPELRPYLLEAAELAPVGAVYVVPERFRKSAMGVSGWRNCNLRTTFEKIIKRAGLEVWPRIFHNLRASRETELAERFPLHVVTAWLGNTPDIAMKHYLQVTDDHFSRAVEEAEKAAQNPAQQMRGDPGKCAQRPNEGETSRQGRQPANPVFPSGCHHLPTNAAHTQVVMPQVHTDGEGFEPPVDFRPLQFSRLPP